MNDIFDRWLLANKKGEKIVDFSTFISMDVSAQGKTISAPTEMGAFAVYNKVLQPTRITVSLGTFGEADKLQAVVNKLTDLRRTATTFSLVSPEQEFKNLTLESFTYSRRREDGVNALYADLILVQIEPMEPDTEQKKRLKPIRFDEEKKTTKNPAAADIAKKTAEAAKTLKDELEKAKNNVARKKDALAGIKKTIKKIETEYKKLKKVYDDAMKLKTAVVNLKAIPNQLVSTVLNGKSVVIEAIQRGDFMAAKVTIDGVLKESGAICANGLDLLQNCASELQGSLSFIDTVGDSDPTYTGLGDRYQLAFVPTQESANGGGDA